MIQQSDLQAVMDARARVGDLARDPVVQEYLAAQREEAELLKGLRERVKAGEEWKSGRWVLQVKRSVATGYEKFLRALMAVPAVAAVLGRDRRAKELAARLAAPAAEDQYCTERVSVDVVPAR